MNDRNQSQKRRLPSRRECPHLAGSSRPQVCLKAAIRIRFPPAGTLCITIAANIADSGILTLDACFPDSVVGFLPSPVFDSARYFEYFVRTAKANLLEFAPATAQKNINLEILESVLIPLPPLNEQRRIVARIDELMALCDQIEQSLLAADHYAAQLLDALIHEAGESTESLEIAA